MQYLDFRELEFKKVASSAVLEQSLCELLRIQHPLTCPAQACCRTLKRCERRSDQHDIPKAYRSYAPGILRSLAQPNALGPGPGWSRSDYRGGGR